VSLAARIDRRRMWCLFGIAWIVLIVVGLVEGPRYDYRAYMKQWARVLAGGNPWLDDPGNVYGVGHQIMAVLFLVHPLAPKLLYILSSFGTFLVMFDAQRRDVAVGLATFALLFATPFFVILTPMYGVEDTLVTFLTLFAVDLRIRKARTLAPALLLAAAVLTKVYPLALLPFIATDRGVINFRFVGLFGVAMCLGLLATVAVWGLPALGIVPFAFVREGKMLSIFWFLSQSALSPIAHSALARALIVWNSAVVAAVMALIYALHFFGKLRALPGTVVAILGLLAFYKVGNPQYFLCAASLLIYFLTVDRDRGTLADRRLLGAAGAYLVVLNVFQIWYQISGGSVRYPEVRAFVGLPAFVTAIVLMWLILSRELRERPAPARDVPLPAKGTNAFTLEGWLR
jgi:hypothetical protein